MLDPLSAEKRVAWSLEHLPGAHVLTSSFGAQAAVSLHLVTRQAPRLPVILLDTGYLFPETYAFIEKLTERLSLNLKVYRSTLSPAWIEARFGKLWEQGVAGLEKYNDLTKLEPMRRALRETGAHSWFSGLRRSQARSRQQHPPARVARGELPDLPDRRVDRSGCGRLPEEARAALPPDVGPRLRVDRRLAHDPPAA